MQRFLSYHILKNFAKVLYSAHQNNTQEMKHTVQSCASSEKLGQNVTGTDTTFLKVLYYYGLILSDPSQNKTK